jgi:hypothetical protein
MSGNTATQPHASPCTFSRAAKELGLKRSEFDLAVHLGQVKTVPDEGGGGRRVTRTELDRLRAAPGYPRTLRASVEAVGTGEAAAVMGVAPSRFTRLARLGLVVPVTFYLNRYRAVVWLYLTDELRRFADDKDNAPLLTGRAPEAMREQVAAGLDLRPRNWRGRHLGFLLRQADGPWQRAAALASLLAPAQVAEIVRDPYERSHLNRFRPAPPAHAAPGSPAAHVIEKIMTADGPDEIDWLRCDLTQTLDEARAHEPAPRPAPVEARAHESAPHPAPVGAHAHEPAPRLSPRPNPQTRPKSKSKPDPVTPRPAVAGQPADRPQRARSGLLGWLRRRSA